MRKLVLFAVLFVLMSSMAWGQVGQDGKYRSYFPQIAIGGGWLIIVSLMNVAADGNSHSIYEIAYVANGDGIAPPAKYLTTEEAGRLASSTMESSGSPFPFGWNANTTMSPDGTLNFSTSKVDEIQSLVTGYMELVQTDAVEHITASVTLQLWENGVKVSEVGVPAVEAKTNNFIPVFVAKKDTQQTGVAIANPNDQAVRVTLELVVNRTYRLNGSYVRGDKGLLTATLEIAPHGHVSKFVPELFPAIYLEPSWRDIEVVGAVLKIKSDLPIPVLGIRTSQVPGVGFTMSTQAAASPK